MIIDQALRAAEQRLAQSPTARLDAEVLLAAVCKKNRTWLYTWGDRVLSDAQQMSFESFLKRREVGEPVAYITGQREFWVLMLETAPSTLIPRPDTEVLVEQALAIAVNTSGRLLDLGTGTGAIALAFASERPAWEVIGVDYSSDAVALAQRNATRLSITNAAFQQSDWYRDLASQQFDIIVSNPPYIDSLDPHLNQGDLRYEPLSALVAEAQGMADFHAIVSEARQYLKPKGWLGLEHGFEQQEAVQAVLKAAGFQSVSSTLDLAGHYRMSSGFAPPK